MSHRPDMSAASASGSGRLRLTLPGVGAMNSPRFAPAGLLLRYGRYRVAFDGGPGADPPRHLGAWLVTDERAELRSELRRMAADRGLVPHIGDLFPESELSVRACPVVHTSHSTCGYRIELGGLLAVWAPELWQFPPWAANADLLFAEAASWNRPICFRGGVGGHASVREVGIQAARHGVRRLVYAHIGRPTIRAIDAGLTPDVGEWGHASMPRRQRSGYGDGTCARTWPSRVPTLPPWPLSPMWRVATARCPGGTGRRSSRAMVIWSWWMPGVPHQHMRHPGVEPRSDGPAAYLSRTDRKTAAAGGPRRGPGPAEEATATVRRAVRVPSGVYRETRTATDEGSGPCHSPMPYATLGRTGCSTARPSGRHLWPSRAHLSRVLPSASSRDGADRARRTS